VATENVDIAIIGGGIHGVGVAQAAAASGYSTILLEKTALAAGTSSRSSKLIHGGLRYLESGQFGLVRESLHERRLLLELAPRLVRPLPVYIPVYRHTRRRPWKIRLGLSLYAMLGGPLDPLMRFRKLKRSQWSELEGLRAADLSAVFEYWEAQTDDAELTRAIMHSAQELGAKLLCPAELVNAERIESGYRLYYRQDNVNGELGCRYLVNASGPWANRVLQTMSPPAEGLPMDLVQGTHIVVEGMMHHKIFYLEAPHDGRAVFVMPWKDNTTLIGTTEHLFTGDPGEVAPLQDEIYYLLETLRHYFPSHSDKVLDSFSGLRVLPIAEHAAFHRPRETILHTDNDHPSLLTIYGGKLTAYRSTAEKIMHRVRPILGAREAKANTNELYLAPVGNESPGTG
jgi:glycerol-3-phosphate dehydrogenase